MLHDDRLTTGAIHEAFADEVTASGGTVAEVFDDGERLFARAVLDRTREVLPDDRFREGVGLRAAGGDVWIHPYVFRQICSNGAIIAHAVQGGRIEGVDAMTPGEAAASIRRAVRACCAEETFAPVADWARSASGAEVDFFMTMMPFLARLSSPRDAVRVLGDLTARFHRDGDSSRYGLMNAVTSTARDTSDPEERWRLEELGGALLAGRTPTPAQDGGLARRPAEALSLIA